MASRARRELVPRTANREPVWRLKFIPFYPSPSLLPCSATAYLRARRHRHDSAGLRDQRRNLGNHPRFCRSRGKDSISGIHVSPNRSVGYGHASPAHRLSNANRKDPWLEGARKGSTRGAGQAPDSSRRCTSIKSYHYVRYRWNGLPRRIYQDLDNLDPGRGGLHSGGRWARSCGCSRRIRS